MKTTTQVVQHPIFALHKFVTADSTTNVVQMELVSHQRNVQSSTATAQTKSSSRAPHCVLRMTAATRHLMDFAVPSLAWDLSSNVSRPADASKATDFDEDSAESSQVTTAPPKCDDNEILDNCPVDCPSDHCPRNRQADQSKCPKPKECPPPACKCGFNSRRAKNGTCIPTRDCPPFKCKGPHEEYNACPSYCPGENCSQATADGKCHLPGHLPVLECKPACRCKKNYWRLNGICVSYKKCLKKRSDTITTTKKPKTTTKLTTKSPKTQKPTTTPAPECGDNEVVDECPTDCPVNYCPDSRYDDQSPCPKPKKCRPPACKCRFNFRRASNGSCIPTRDCPPFECNRENEEHNPCPPYCPGENCSQATPDGECHIFGRIGIILECVPACRCKKNFWRLDGICVPYEQCPKTNNTSVTTEPVETTETTEPTLTCGDNEYVDNCPTVCPSDYCPKNRDDGNPLCPQPIKCPPPACKCGFNHRRADNGTCIATIDCPPFDCDGPYEEYNACPPYCPGEDCSQATPDGECHAVGNILIPVECRPACRCKKNYWRLNGVCVPYKKCPKRNETSMVRCGPFETIDDCPVDCPGNHCPKSEDADFSPCVRPKKCPPPKCVCGMDTRRNDNGSCVAIQDCPPFQCSRPNEEYRACYPESPGEDCSEAVAELDSSNELRSLICKPACRCKKGFWRLNGACVPYEQCKLPCGQNEQSVSCKNSCSDSPCPKSEKDTEPRFCTQECRGPGCACLPNHKRAANGTCIPTKECPPFDCSARPNEEYNPCPPLCPTDSCSQASPTGKCPAILGRIGTLLICNPKCRCKKGYWRNDKGICIPYEECPNICPENEEYSNCTQNVCRAQNCTQKDQAILCLREISEPCKTGCVCKKGYLRNENGDCVLEDKCTPKPTPPPCPKNEFLTDCASACPNEYCPKNEADTEPVLCTLQCVGSACVCNFNHKRADNGSCIPTRDCPPFKCTRPNEEFNACPPFCPSDSCADASPDGRCLIVGIIGVEVECSPKCRCTKGYWRNDEDVCIPYAECPGVCPTNEEYTNCSEMLCRPQNCSDIAGGNEAFTCEPEKVKGCQAGCVCKEGYVRAENGTCVSYEECPNSSPICPGPYEEYTECKQTCPGDTCAALTSKFPCPEECCEPGCVCANGYRRESPTGSCIPLCSCPEMSSAPACQLYAEPAIE